MKKSRKFISMPIISIVEGVQIGTVKGLVINPEKREIAALIIDQKGWFREQKIIPFNKVAHVGDDAITINQSGNVEKTTNLPEILKLLREKNELIDVKVISETGKVLGQVDEYYVDEKSGQIISLEISGKLIDGLIKGKGLLPVSQIRTLGTDAIVTMPGAEESITKIDGGLQETFSSLKDNTSTLWNATRQKTLELSKNFKEKTKEKIRSNIEPSNEFAENATNPVADSVATTQMQNTIVAEEEIALEQFPSSDKAAEDTSYKTITPQDTLYDDLIPEEIPSGSQPSPEDDERKA